MLKLFDLNVWYFKENLFKFYSITWRCMHQLIYAPTSQLLRELSVHRERGQWNIYYIWTVT